MTASIQRRRRLATTILTAVAAVTIGMYLSGWLMTREPLSHDELTQAAIEAFSLKNERDAEKYLTRLLLVDPASRQACFLKGCLAHQKRNWNKSIEWFDRIPDDGTPVAVKSRCSAGNVALFQLMQITAAEQFFERALAQDPQCIDAHNQLAYLLGLQSRNKDALPHRLATIRYGPFSATDLYLVSLGDRAMDDPQVVSRYVDIRNPDPGATLGWARVLSERGATQDAERMFESLLESRVQRAEALSRWGSLLLASGQSERRRVWEAAARSVTDHPGVWYIFGLLAQERQDMKATARCFWEVVRRDPEHATANYRLGQILVNLQRPSDARPFLERANRLEAYARAAELAFRVGAEHDLKLARETAVECGLPIEAWGWSQCLTRQKPNEREIEETHRLESRLPTTQLFRSAPSENPALGLDLSDWSWEQTSSNHSQATASKSAQMDAQIAFEEMAASSGLDFQYLNGGHPATGLVHMFEVTGGGVAVLDFDRDERPDVYFAQGGPWTPEAKRPQTDRLFRNQPIEMFADVTESAGISETGFSVGVCVGDFDSDGFPDVYVTNIGQNSLLHNQGDGTFNDVTIASGVLDSDYSSSAAMADFSGDGLPDLYVVNYLSGTDLWDRVCGGADGIPRSCLPQSFPAAPHRFFLNLGDGRYLDQTRECGVAKLAGKGLGIIAARFDGKSRLGLFIANDVGPNFLLQNVADSRERPVQFADVGLIAGVALNGNGRSESAMGATAGDIDGDGSLDLFVTNFEDETNTLYLQKAEMQFEDATARSGLAESSRNLVGWGTQFLDADLDGWLDLAVTNGHINNLSDHGKRYQMMPLFYRNSGGRRMTRLPASETGDYFLHSYLGRGMARFDWNRDGLEDLVITHLDSPAALLTNRSRGVGHWLGISLSGARCERDAIGATVSVRTRMRTLVRQMTAGDGNQSTNERRLLFGLGEEADINDVTVEWPNGVAQQFGPLNVDIDYRLIENDSCLHQLTGSR